MKLKGENRKAVEKFGSNYIITSMLREKKEAYCQTVQKEIIIVQNNAISTTFF